MDTLSWIFLYLLLPLALGLLGNFATPWIRSLFIKGSISMRERRIEALVNEYRRIKAYRDNNGLFLGSFLSHIALILVDIASLVAIVGFLILESFYSPRPPATSFQNGVIYIYLLMIMVYYLAVSITLLRVKVRDFDKYKEKTIKKLLS
jgi:hypothetical protein